MKKWVSLLSVTLLLFAAGSVLAEEEKKEEKQEGKQEEKMSGADQKRQKIDNRAKEAMDRLFSESEKAGDLYKQAVGYAVFDNTRVTFGITGGGGTGVAVEKESGERTYMKMATGGVALGIGAQSYQVIFFFQDEKTFRNFVDKGWEAESGAGAAAGTAGANVNVDFRNGMASWVITKAGLIASADLSGTKYWQNDKLNKQ
jgi:lipid-binding SYLF domain-containing protein